MSFLGISEILIMLLFSSGGVGLPLGIPPTAEDPLLANVAPDECTFYLSWAGMAQPDAESSNHTEQLLAEPEVQTFMQHLDQAITAAIVDEAGDRETRKIVAETAPTIVKAILSKPGAAFVGKVSLSVRGIDVDGGLIVNVGDQLENLKQAVARLETALGDQVRTVDVAGESWKEFPMPEDAPRMLWGFRGKYMILGVGEGSVERIMQRVRTEPPAWLTRLREQLAVPRTSTVMYVNVPAVTAFATAMSREPEMQAVIGALGLSNVDYLGVVTGLDETDYLMRAVVAIDGKPSGLFSLAGGKPLAKADLAPIPADSTFAMAARLDVNATFEEFRQGLANVSPDLLEEFDDEVNGIEQATGLKLSADVLQPLGDTWRFYNSPGDGGLLFTGLTAVVSVSDRDRVARTLEKIEKLSVEAAPSDPDTRRRRRHVVVRHFEFAGEKIYFLNSVGEEMPFAPAWCVTDKELIVSLFPSHVKSYVSRGDDFRSLAEVPEVAEQFGAGSGPVMLGYQDTRALFQLWYPVVQIVAQFVCSEAQRQGVDFDISMLPSAAAIAPHLGPGTMTVQQTDGSIELTSRQSVPIISGPMPMLVPLTIGVGGMSFAVAREMESQAFAAEREATAVLEAAAEAEIGEVERDEPAPLLEEEDLIEQPVP